MFEASVNTFAHALCRLHVFHAWIEMPIKSTLDVFSAIVVEITSWVYTKTIILFNLGEKWQNIYLAALRLGKYSTTIQLDFKE